MAKVEAFNTNIAEYEAWFEKYKYVYESELDAVKSLLPGNGIGLEIGVGTGRFAVPLGIRFGVEPSPAMRNVAQKKGVKVIDGVAEALPLDNEQYDSALFVTTICFVDSLEAAFKEAYRILKPGGTIVIGFVDKNSPLGKRYEKSKKHNPFYRDATFYSVKEIASYLEQGGFKSLSFVQTIFKDLDMITTKEPIKEGYGEGAFVVVSGKKDIR